MQIYKHPNDKLPVCAYLFWLMVTADISDARLRHVIGCDRNIYTKWWSTKQRQTYGKYMDRIIKLLEDNGGSEGKVFDLWQRVNGLKAVTYGGQKQ